MEKANTIKKWCVKSINKPHKLVNYASYLARFAKKCLHDAAADGYVLGISGGIDSALAVAILSNTSDIKIIGAFIDIESSPQDKADAELLSQTFKFDYRYINLTDEYRSIVNKLGIGHNSIAKSNLKVRMRVSAIYALANANNYLTCGTTNAAERLVGYYTKFGDNACDVALLCYLTKTNVRFLAQYLKVPQEILDKKPSAGLHPGQTDEQDMEITYQEIDHYLSYAVIDQIQEAKITTRYVANKHKLNAPIRPKKFMPLRNTK